MVHRRIWLLACVWCLIWWTTPAQASWEAYQQAGESAYTRGDYDEAERMFLAAVREARHFGPQDPRLDISLSKLALLRVIRGQSSMAGSPSQPSVRTPDTAPPRQLARRSHQRRQPHRALRRARPGQRTPALGPARPRERSKSAQGRVALPERRPKRPRAVQHRTAPPRRVAPPVRPGKRGASAPRRSSQQAQQHTPPRAMPQQAARQERAVPPLHQDKQRADLQVPRRQRGHQGQRPRATLRRPGAPPPEPPLRPDIKRQGQPMRPLRRARLHTEPPRLAQNWPRQRAMV